MGRRPKRKPNAPPPPPSGPDDPRYTAIYWCCRLTMEPAVAAVEAQHVFVERYGTDTDGTDPR